MTERDRNVNKWTGKDKCGQRNETMMDWNNRNVDRKIKKGQEKDEKRKDGCIEKDKKNCGQRDGLEKRQGDGQNLDRYLDKKWTGKM